MYSSLIELAPKKDNYWE